jgi:hypothetical protein
MSVREQHEATDRALATFVIAVEQVDGDRVSVVDGATSRGGGVGVWSEEAMPEAVIARRHVHVARQVKTLIGLRRWVVFVEPTGVKGPALQHREPRAGVAKGDCQVCAVVARLYPAMPAGHAHGVAVGKANLFGWILWPRRY